MHVAVMEFFAGGCAHFSHDSRKHQCLPGKRMIAVDDDFVARNPDLGSALANDMSDKLKRAAEHMAVLGQLKSTERVAYFLLQLAEVYNRKMAQSEPLQLHLTREQIADHLGLRLETVSRCFTLLKNDRLIALVGSDAVAILDRRRLAEFARLGTV